MTVYFALIFVEFSINFILALKFPTQAWPHSVVHFALPYFFAVFVLKTVPYLADPLLFWRPGWGKTILFKVRNTSKFWVQT